MSLKQNARIDEAPGSAEFFLRTEHLYFRPWSPDDLELATGLWGDEEVTRLIGGPFAQAQVRERLAREIASLNAYGVQYWPVFLLPGGEHLGCCGLRPYQPERKIYEIGFHLRPPYWGRGYAAEAARAVMAYAFDKLGAAGLFAGHHPANEASRRLLGKLGFRYTHDEYYPPTGLNHPSHMITAEEYKMNVEV